MLDSRPVSLSPSMTRHYQQSYQHDYASKQALPAVDRDELQQKEDAEEIALQMLLEAFPNISLEDIATAYTESDSDVNAAADILSSREPDLTNVPPQSGVPEVRSSLSPTRSQNPGVPQVQSSSKTIRSQNCSLDKAEQDEDLLIQRYGVGVADLRSRDSSSPQCINTNHIRQNFQYNKVETRTFTPVMVNPALSGDVGNPRGRSRQSDRDVNGVARDNLLALGKKKTKKKRGRNGILIENLEPKDAASRRAVEKVVLDMLGGEFHLGDDVVGDVVSGFEGDPEKSLAALKQLGCHVEVDINGKDGGPTNTFKDGELDTRDDPLQIIMGAFPNVDPASVVMAMQEHKGDVEKVSSALLLAGECPSDYYLAQEKVDQNHFGVKLILKQLNELYPAVNNNRLYEVLQSTNFDVRDAAAVVEAGLAPDPEQTQCTVSSKVEQMSFSQTLLKNKHKGSGESSISSTPQSQQASANKTAPNTPAKHKWAVVTLKDSHPHKCDPERKNSLSQSKPCGDLDDYNYQRQSAKENWQKMKHCLREAGAAHRRGQGSYAGILADKGKHYKQLAQLADERASQQIFHHRNKDIVNNITIDLHAQHVKEAIQVLKLHLSSLSSISSVHSLTIITGYGSHSNAGQAKIKPAVIRFLAKSGIPWKELNSGCLTVKMSDACKELYKGDDFSSS